MLLPLGYTYVALQKVLPKPHSTAPARPGSPAWYHTSSRSATPASAPTPSRLGPGASTLAVTTDLQDGSGLGSVAGGAVLQQHRGLVSAPEQPWDRGGYMQDFQPAGLGVETSVLVPWFAVTAELLGDVIRLAWHWHEVDRRREAAAAHAAEGATAPDGAQVGGVPVVQQRQGGFPREIAERLSVADWALCRLAQTMDMQVATGGRQQGTPAAAVSQAGVPQSQSYGSLQDIAGDAAGQVDMTASMEALAVRLLRPPPDVDQLFVTVREHKDQLLTGESQTFVLNCRLGYSAIMLFDTSVAQHSRQMLGLQPVCASMWLLSFVSMKPPWLVGPATYWLQKHVWLCVAPLLSDAAVLHVALSAADEEMHTLLEFSTVTAIDSVVNQRVTPRFGTAAAAGGSPITPTTGTQAAGLGRSPNVVRHRRSNSYPDGRHAAAELAAPYPTMGLHVEVPEAPTEPAAAAAVPSASASRHLLGSGDGGTGLSTPNSAVSYPGGPSSSGLPQSIFLEANSDAAGGPQQGLWHNNPAFRASWDLDEQQQQQPQLVGLRRSSSADGPRSPFETAQEAAGLHFKDKRIVRSLSSGTGSPLIATSYDGGAPHQADSDTEAPSSVSAAAAAVAAAAPRRATEPGVVASGAPLQQGSRPSSSSGGTLAQRRALNIAPLGQPSSSAAGAGRGNRFETWRSTLSPVPSASYDHGLASGLVSSASAAPTFGRRSSTGVDMGLATAGSVPGGYAPTPASRISGFGSQLFSLSGRRLRVATLSGSSSSAEVSDEDGSSSENEDDMEGRTSPTKLQATRLQGKSFTHISGSSMRQIARSMRRMGGECAHSLPV